MVNNFMVNEKVLFTADSNLLFIKIYFYQNNNIINFLLTSTTARQCKG